MFRVYGIQGEELEFPLWSPADLLRTFCDTCGQILEGDETPLIILDSGPASIWANTAALKP